MTHAQWELDGSLLAIDTMPAGLVLETLSTKAETLLREVVKNTNIIMDRETLQPNAQTDFFGAVMSILDALTTAKQSLDMAATFID